MSELNARGVEFLVVGAHALATYGHVRATKDLGLWVRPTLENGHRVIAALQNFGAPLLDLRPHDLTQEGLVFQIGVAPVRIDILTAVDGLTFKTAWNSRNHVELSGLTVPVLSRDLLILNKRTAGRPQDIADLQ